MVTGGTVWRERDALVFEASKDPLHGDGAAQLRVEQVEGRDPEEGFLTLPGARSVMVAGDKIEGPLTIRFWADGDRFIPLGMTGSKKIKSLLTDRKVDSSLRHRVRVVCDTEKIVWVVGHQIDNRVRIMRETTKILRLSVGD